MNSIQYLSKSNEPHQNLKLFAEHRIKKTEKIAHCEQEMAKEHYEYKKGLCLTGIVTSIAAGILIGAFISIPAGILAAGCVVVPIALWRAFCIKQKEDQANLTEANKELNEIFASVGDYLYELRRLKSNSIIQAVANEIKSKTIPLNLSHESDLKLLHRTIMQATAEFDRSASELFKNAIRQARILNNFSLTDALNNAVYDFLFGFVDNVEKPYVEVLPNEGRLREWRKHNYPNPFYVTSISLN